MVVTKQFSYTVGNSCAETAIDNPTVSESFFYPNPTQDKLQIKSGQIINQVIVRNLVGQIIELQKVDNTETNLDLSQLSAGNYFVTLKLANGKSTTQKIVKL
jgi:hypothetical protein